MALSSLPFELTRLIVEELEYESEINALARTDRALYQTVNPMLYRHNVQHEDSSALAWAIEHDAIATARKILDAG
ncbi:hypothetical protein BO70DRAFT_290806, partial [Aspergillus heteromorphus CBS 117.55]